MSLSLDRLTKLMQLSQYQMILAMMEVRYEMAAAVSTSRLAYSYYIRSKKFRLLYKTTNNMKGADLILYQLFLTPLLPDWLLRITPILSVFMEYSSSLQSHVATSLNKLTFCSLLFQPKLKSLIDFYSRETILSMAPRIFKIRIESDKQDTKKMIKQILKGSGQNELLYSYFQLLNQKREEFFKVKNANLSTKLNNKAKKHMRYRQSLGSKEPTTKPNKVGRETKYRSRNPFHHDDKPASRRHPKKQVILMDPTNWMGEGMGSDQFWMNQRNSK